MIDNSIKRIGVTFVAISKTLYFREKIFQCFLITTDT
jgi:hypothetical protein